MMAACPMHRDVIRSHGGLYLYHVTFTEYAAIVHADHDLFLAYGQCEMIMEWKSLYCIHLH